MPLVRWWSTKSSAERWGVATVVLLAIAAVAWLALWQPLTRDIAALRVANARDAAALVEARHGR
jgi:type II secretory pathway component PulM